MITIIDYKSGNIASVKNALEKLGFESVVTSNPSEIEKAKKVIFPGVGRASTAMQNLREMDLIDVIKNLKIPFLGICLGMQVLTDFSEEDNTNCLGIINGKVEKYLSKVRVPQVGWNKVFKIKDSPLFKDINDEEYFYFVNSFALKSQEDSAIGTSFYGEEFISAVNKNNFYATQFHPEKSGKSGLKLLNNFCTLC